MGARLKNISLIGLGMVAGFAASMQFSAQAQKSAGNLPLEELRQLSEVFGLIKTNYVEPTEDRKLLTEAMVGMVSSLDPHSSYLDKKSFRELSESTQGKFVGLGIEVGMEDGYVKVVSPIEDSPAYRAGVKAGDLIVRLDSTPVKGLTLDEAVKKMRGEPNTKITLTISRKDEDKPVLITITREEIKVRSVKSKVIEPGYAWLRISQFQEPTLEDAVKAINNLYKQDPNLKGIVLDMRNDPGGVLSGAIGISSIFLPKDKLVVYTSGQLSESKQNYYAKREYYAGRSLSDPLAKLPEAVKNVPLVVLINSGSASASEIVAGALQDYQRAKLIGSTTFGKGSVQTVLRLPEETGLKLTTARYYTPNGRSIQAKGITPDLLVNEYADGDGLNSLRLREADLQKHLNNDKDASANGKADRKEDLEEQQKLIEQERKRKPVEFGSKEDFQLQQALNYFKGIPVQTAKVDPKLAEGKDAKGKKSGKADKEEKKDASKTK
ncbi:S41 family peptidase [Massilia sp. W12]|uniref:S41 family peptidase n=1 Tax=Massilia sp. W12 TaxID=3126507 RepID=UPI0030D047F4